MRQAAAYRFLAASVDRFVARRGAPASAQERALQADYEHSARSLEEHGIADLVARGSTRAAAESTWQDAIQACSGAPFTEYVVTTLFLPGMHDSLRDPVGLWGAIIVVGVCLGLAGLVFGHYGSRRSAVLQRVLGEVPRQVLLWAVLTALILAIGRDPIARGLTTLRGRALVQWFDAMGPA